MLIYCPREELIMHPNSQYEQNIDVKHRKHPYAFLQHEKTNSSWKNEAHIVSKQTQE